MPKAVLDMMDKRPIWAMPGWVSEEIRAALPPEWACVVIDETTDGSGDGAARLSDSVMREVADADVYLGYGVPEALVLGGPSLRWIHTGAAGVGSSLTPALVASDIVFTNSAGIHAAPMAETVLGMILYFGRGLHFAVRSQREHRWDTGPYYAAGAPLAELSASTVGIIGFGGIGREVAARVSALGGHILAVRRRAPNEVAGSSANAPGAEPAKGVEVLHGAEGLARVLAESDIVVLAAPETAETRGMMDARAFAQMKPGALFINVARGKLVDEDALLDALDSGRLRGAGLDVFAKEPLRPDHPLWSAPNVLVTPHVSAVTRGFWRRQTDLILHNLGAFLRGEPIEMWRNVVDKKAGY